jgi:hypothetical protein
MKYPIHGFMALVIGIGVGMSAHAQVYKCPAPGGKTVYADQPCIKGSSAGLIERERTPAEIQQERMQAYQAEQAKQQRYANERSREMHEAQVQRYQQPAPAVRSNGADWQARKDRENARTAASSITNNGGRWDESGAIRRYEARREAGIHPPVRPRTQPQITHCDAGFCYDNQGATYHRNGPDFLTAPGGKTCHRAGAVWNCP